MDIESELQLRSLGVIQIETDIIIIAIMIQPVEFPSVISSVIFWYA